jgi:hypothetical protein
MNYQSRPTSKSEPDLYPLPISYLKFQKTEGINQKIDGILWYLATDQKGEDQWEIANTAIGTMPSLYWQWFWSWG